ncbi:Predicted arabinose efflux permease, MFS family [Stigmatella aurantiaca]|uniref:Predicted arabinose efflux permease, MFS family n=1 Tax=Stigmatella aurantiaca TaxID=41 RepID=A0A1H8A0T9_STIAU|nr:MFS transporter [Stigmatella aurantiaca]SEM64532.1 Predicted arabinose efflux permease, MFS family [Stigmatella aurantiaca]
MLRATMASPTLAARVTAQVRAAAGGLPATFWFLWTGTLVNRLGSFVTPLLAIYLTRERGFSAEQAGLVASLQGAGAVLSGPLGGAIADRLGRRAALVLSLWLGSAGMLFLGFSETFLWIHLAAFTLGVLGEMYRPVVSTTIADVVRPEDRVRAYGLLFWVVNIGFAIALPLAGWASQAGFRLLFIADAATTFVYGCLVWWRVPESGAPRGTSARAFLPSLRPMLAPLKDKVFRGFGIPTFLGAFIFFQCMVSLSLDLKDRGFTTAEFGLVMSVNGTLIVLLQPFVSTWVTRWRRSAVLAASGLLTGVGFGLHALSVNLTLAALAVVVWTLGEILHGAVSLSVVADLAPPEQRGSYQGAYYMLWGLAGCAAPAVGGWVLDHLGRNALWGGCLVLGLIVAGWHLAVAQDRRRHLEALRLRFEGVSAHED